MAGRGASAYPQNNKETCVTHRITDPKEKAGIAKCLSECKEETNRNKVYGKYLIFDAVSGQPKIGKYFVLRLDSERPKERKAVRIAMMAYAKAQEEMGNIEYAKSIRKYVRGK